MMAAEVGQKETARCVPLFAEAEENEKTSQP